MRSVLTELQGHARFIPAPAPSVSTSPPRVERHSSDSGFSLIELMVVVLIIGILTAIAVPAFLSAQRGAKGRAAESNVRAALSAVRTIYGDRQTYALALTDLAAGEPSLGWMPLLGTGATASTKPAEVSWLGSANLMVLAVKSNSGTCYLIKDDVGSGTSAGTGYAKYDASTTTCVAAAAPVGVQWSKDQAAAGW